MTMTTPTVSPGASRVVAGVVAVAAAAGAAGVIAAGAVAPRLGLWAGLAGVAAVAVGMWRSLRAAVLGGVLALVGQYALASIGRSTVDVSSALVGGLLVAVVEAAHWGLAYADAASDGRTVALRLARVFLVGTGGWIVGAVVLVASTPSVDPLPARAVAVGLVVTLWLIVAQLLRRRMTDP